jgi:Sugar-tranasporters, 12 TM
VSVVFRLDLALDGDLLTNDKDFLFLGCSWSRALDVLLIMTAFLLLTTVLTYFYTPDDEKAEATNTTNANSNGKAAITSRANLHKEFDSFRHKYIVVYLIIMLADWMQGTHMYTLYLSYNVNVSALFLTGFLSGALFAPILGSFVDKFGRKNSCIVYCVLEIIINILEHSHDFGVLLFGRVLGGVSTNLLFSAFESWMATEHRKRGFPEEWMSRTYAEVS